jgi:hypothetical protein
VSVVNIFAGSYAEAADWAHRNGLSNTTQWRYLEWLWQVYSMRGVKVYMVGHYRQRPGYSGFVHEFRERDCECIEGWRGLEDRPGRSGEPRA